MVNKVQVQERDPNLHAHCHGHLVGVGEIVVRQEEPLLQRQHSLEGYNRFGEWLETFEHGSGGCFLSQASAKFRSVQIE